VTSVAKKLSNPFSTGGGGPHFEAHVQASFVALMLTGGFAPCLPCWPIKKVKLQGKFLGYETDDLIVVVAREGGQQERKLLGQIKHSISITENDSTFGEVIQAAWNDFSNDRVFSRNRDAFALITGPLSATDIGAVRPLLERARHSEDCAEFFTSTELGNFASDDQRRKLKAFRAQLLQANGGQEVPDQTVFDFLRHFHLLGYDLDIKAGVTLSLLHSLIGQNSQASAQALWAMLVGEVQSANKNAGTLTKETVSEDVRAAFTKRVPQSIPNEYTVPRVADIRSELSDPTYAPELSVANLLGSWDERKDADRAVIEQLASGRYSEWIGKVRETLQQPNAPLSLKEGRWRVIDRLPLWQALGGRVFDDQLDVFKQCGVNVLGENDPKFELPADERYGAGIYDKALSHSSHLRKGIAETLAILGAHPEPLTHCSKGKAEATAVLAVREILRGADWVQWASLNGLLPLLAEAAPREFLDAVEEALNANLCPFDKVFEQEGGGIWGSNYMTGLLWGLETLAWDPEYLTRVVIILGELAARDPGGNWANRPANSLSTILLPWLPQTCAGIAGRKAAVSALLHELPHIAWRLLLSLLPQSHQASLGSRKPAWRETIPDDWTQGVTRREYWEQIIIYTELAILAAMNDLSKLIDLTDRLGDLPLPAHEQLVAYLGSKALVSMPEAERVQLWNKLVGLVSTHRKFADAEWAMTPEQVDKLSAVAERLAPDAPAYRHRRLFDEQDSDLYEETGNYEEQRNGPEERRQGAVGEIFATGGMLSVLEFAGAVESSWRVGFAFGMVATSDADRAVLPTLLETEDRSLAQFAGGFVWGRFRSGGWQWTDAIDTSEWTPAQIGQFLAYLPFTSDTWSRSTRLLGEDESPYWTRTNANPYEARTGLEVAIDRLVEHDRPRAAIRCLNKMRHDEQPLDSRQVVRTLLSALHSPETPHATDAREITEVIKVLQQDPSTNLDDLFRVEWAYLPLLDRHHGASAKLLEQRLADDPDFFCEVIRTVFRSKNEERAVEEPTEQQKNIATNAYRLLHQWRTPPGSQKDGTYNAGALVAWLEHVKASCAESGHLEIALTMVGRVLIYAPQDLDGLWLHRSVATALNAKDAKDMRDGFRTELFNSRGVHDFTAGGEERGLAAGYRRQADQAESAGFHRLANSLRELAASYERDAERESSRDPFDD